MILSMAEKNYNGIDIMKLCMAIVVIAIHTQPESLLVEGVGREVVELIYDIAVPCFFTASGFLLFRKIQYPLEPEGRARLRRYLRKICRMYVLWTLFYLPFTIWGFAQEGMAPLKAFVVFLRNVLLVGENLYSWPLWYLLALIVSVCVIWLCSSCKLKLWHVLMMSLLLHGVGLCLDYCQQAGLFGNVVGLYFRIFKTARNGLFEGLMYVSLGVCLACLHGRIKRGVLAIGILTGFSGALLRYPFANVLLVVSLFALTLNGGHSVSVRHCKYYRVMSSIIYFTHMFFVVLWGNLCHVENLKALYVFILLLLSSVLLSVILLRYKDNRLFKICFQ